MPLLPPGLTFHSRASSKSPNWSSVTMSPPPGAEVSVLSATFHDAGTGPPLYACHPVVDVPSKSARQPLSLAAFTLSRALVLSAAGSCPTTDAVSVPLEPLVEQAAATRKAPAITMPRVGREDIEARSVC